MEELYAILETAAKRNKVKLEHIHNLAGAFFWGQKGKFVLSMLRTDETAIEDEEGLKSVARPVQP